jgi:hypothetical protein
LVDRHGGTTSVAVGRAHLIRALVLLLALSPSAWAFDDDVSGEDALSRHKPGPKWQEQQVVVPDWPREDDLIEVPLSLRDFPFKLWIDGASLQVGEDRVVRYTGVLRSASGAENVFFEGIRCSEKEYQRYAYGSDGKFQPLQDPQWQRVRSTGHGRYRAALMDGVMCPLPGIGSEKQLRRRLKTGPAKRDF